MAKGFPPGVMLFGIVPNAISPPHPRIAMFLKGDFVKHPRGTMLGKYYRK